MKYIWSVFTYLILLISCTPKPLEIDIPSAPVKLVVASQLIPERAMIVGVTKTFSPLENATDSAGNVTEEFLNSVYVKNAIVVISYDGRKDTLIAIDTLPGIYFSPNILRIPYTNYTLEVYDPESYMRVSATTTMPTPVRFDTVYTSLKGQDVYLNFSFKDPDKEKNWYIINYYKSKEAKAGLDVIDLPFKNGNNYLIDWELINDEGMSNHTFTKKKKLLGITTKDTIGITLTSITEGHYKFLDAQKRSGSIISSLTSEPINLPTNVINGYGYFSATFPDARVFDLNFEIKEK